MVTCLSAQKLDVDVASSAAPWRIAASRNRFKTRDSWAARQAGRQDALDDVR